MTGFDVAENGAVLGGHGRPFDDLAQVDGMLQLYDQGYPVVAGSRYMKGGRLIGGPFFKQMLSQHRGTSLVRSRQVAGTSAMRYPETKALTVSSRFSSKPPRLSTFSDLTMRDRRS